MNDFGQIRSMSLYSGGSTGLYSTAASQQYTQQGMGETIGAAIESAPSNNDFVQGMKWGYAGATMTLGPFNAYRKARTEKRILKWQAELQDLQTKALQTAADDVMRSAHRAIAAKTFDYGQAKSSARATTGASGVRVNASGSSAEVLTSLDIAKEMDAAQIYANAVAQSWGYRKQAVNSNNQKLALEAAAHSVSPWAAAITQHLMDGIKFMNSDMGQSLMSQGGQGGQGGFGGMSIGNNHKGVSLQGSSRLSAGSLAKFGGK